ncbi:hypothetical protein AB0N73_05665 [Microbacterium sp. NPDC089189]|uniref:hypothetical protein n=1 Tax=Microbacterium sp. NPDC089189 TaxID=3154972 RepID=UPI00341FBF6B
MTAPATVAAFADVFDEIGAGTVERERERRLPYAEVELLRRAGFTRVTLPVSHGGRAASPSELFELLAELARRDPNLAQLLRSHFSFVDRALHAAPGARRDRQLALVADGSIHGNATFERGPAAVGSVSTAVTRDAAGLRLDGRKFYSTGTLFADLVSVLAEHDGAQVGVMLRTDAEGVERIDDWRGFGQRLTGSGSTVFRNVRVDPDDILPRDPARVSHAGAFVQLVLLAAAAGIGRAVLDDATAFVRSRTRGFSHGSARAPQDDPIVQEVVGDVAAASFAADAALAAASHALDRHWRNARTLASHNPARYKARALGEHLLAGTPLAAWWSVGEV